jgi:hypothetical protein
MAPLGRSRGVDGGPTKALDLSTERAPFSSSRIDKIRPTELKLIEPSSSCSPHLDSPAEEESRRKDHIEESSDDDGQPE